MVEANTEVSAETTLCDAKVRGSEDEKKDGEITLVVSLWRLDSVFLDLPSSNSLELKVSSPVRGAAVPLSTLESS